MGGAVATVSQVVCDACGSTEKVSTLTVVYQFGNSKPWEIDMCDSCYQSRLGDVRERGRRARISNTRPQARIVKTEIKESNL